MQSDNNFNSHMMEIINLLFTSISSSLRAVKKTNFVDDEEHDQTTLKKLGDDIIHAAKFIKMYMSTQWHNKYFKASDTRLSSRCCRRSLCTGCSVCTLSSRLPRERGIRS